ncbi:hypothetical protein D3C87_1946860 [compost metagenome]
MCGDRRGTVGRYVQNTLLAFLSEEHSECFPDLQGAWRWAGKKCAVCLVGLVVVLDEVADVNGVAPLVALKTGPSVGGDDCLGKDAH